MEISEYMEYNRGSEWRRWDLHIHTPCTKKNDLFTGNTPEEKWDNYYSDVINYVTSGEDNHKVAVLGITDYFSIDNYRKIISDKRITSNFDMILPNIEMRMVPVSSKTSINIHFIVNPDFVSQLDSKLFNQLKFEHSSGKIFHAIYSDFIALGRLNNPSFDDVEAYKAGIEQFVVEFSNIKDVLKDKDLRDNVLIAVANGSKDGASGIGNPTCENENSDLTTIRSDIYYLSDIIFSSSEKDIRYFLGKGVDTPDLIKQKYGRLKPCIHGSDAHKNADILAPYGDRFCWIKADCTFEGLKQIIFEPEQRVYIGCQNPDQKKGYNVIDKVIISNENFSSQPILFNPNLTCIIGGRSTGKSILLNNMARQIDIEQYESKKNKTNSFEINNVKVIWKDGYESDGNNKSRHIVYIPQTYLNRLSDEQEEKTEIDEIILSILMQDSEISHNHRLFEEELDRTKMNLDKDILDLLSFFNAKKSISEKLKEHGTTSAIKKEIEKLKNHRDKLTQSLNISEKDIQEYELLKISIQKDKELIEVYSNDIKLLENCAVSIALTQSIDSFSEEISSKINRFIDEKTIIIKNEWETQKTLLLDDRRRALEITKEKITNNQSLLKEKERLIETSEAIKEINKQIANESIRFEDARKFEALLKEKEEEFTSLFETIVHKLSTFNEIHQRFATIVNNRAECIDSNMRFIATAPFRLEQFDLKVRAIFDNRKLKSIYSLYEDGMAGDIDEKTILNLIKPLFGFDGESFLKKGNTIEDALRAVLSNWYNIIYTVELDGDKIQTMSPGKKAIVLLKLLINMAESACPILIDQPEDDLDNRSIYVELVNFIKEKKNERQIIIVTHNANIVIGADSEEIIIANQQGANTPNETFRFEYRSGSIENNEKVYDNTGRVKNGILNQFGIQDHICGLLEGGKEAFNLRKTKYTLI